MKSKMLICLTFITLFACSHTKQKKKIVTAPSQDQYWNSVADESMEDKSVIHVLDETYPHLSTQIKKDALDPYLLMFWGERKNFDSNAKKKIVNDKIIDELQTIFNIKNDNSIVHAGVMHTYGYLFSTIDTPYGYKRKRWIAPTINIGLGLKSRAFSPETNEGGLFSNVTYFGAMVAFKNKTELSLLKNVSNEVFTLDYSKLKIDRIEENTQDQILVTSLVHFPYASGDDNKYLLVYSTIDKKLNKELLISVFPIDESAYNKLVDVDLVSGQLKIPLRYNAHIANFGEAQLGTRKIIKNYSVK